MKRVMRKRTFAFTLAEVLITLGIIGIVAAMTIPALMNYFQSQALTAGLKKSYSIINNALIQYKSDYGTVGACYYGVNGAADQWGGCSAFFNSFKDEFKVVKYCSDHAYTNDCIPMYSGGDTLPNQTQTDIDNWNAACPGLSQSKILNNTPAIVLSDGEIIFAYSSAIGSMGAPLLAVDVNGAKQPNKWGFDIFTLRILSDGSFFKITGQGACQPNQGGKGAQYIMYN